MPGRRPRVLFLTVDGPRGLGHLSRAAKLARSIQDLAACVLVTGLRDTCHLVPEHCEYVRLPGLEGGPGFAMVESPGWPFVTALASQMRTIRREILLALERTFAPDLIVTDQYPTGWYSEWEAVLAGSQAMKCIMFRPIPGANTVEHLASGAELRALRLYDQIWVAGDPRTAVVDEDLGFGAPERAKLRYIGYISVPVSAAEIDTARRERGLGPGDRWVVCSAGAGLVTGDLIEDCFRLAEDFPGVWFDIVVGPRSTRVTESGSLLWRDNGRVRVAGQRRDLRLAHAAADVVICHGGYNSVCEAMEGGAALIVDGRHDVNQERRRHAQLLQSHYPIAIAERAADLARHLRAILSGDLDRRPIRETGALAFDACGDFARLVATRSR